MLITERGLPRRREFVMQVCILISDLWLPGFDFLFLFFSLGLPDFTTMINVASRIAPFIPLTSLGNISSDSIGAG